MIAEVSGKTKRPTIVAAERQVIRTAIAYWRAWVNSATFNNFIAPELIALRKAAKTLHYELDRQKRRNQKQRKDKR